MVRWYSVIALGFINDIIGSFCKEKIEIMDTNCVLVAAGNIKRHDVIKLPEIDTVMQVLIEPCRQGGNTEIIYQGKPYIYPHSKKILLIKKATL